MTDIDTVKLFSEFKDWVGRKPAEDRYTYIDPAECAFARYLQSIGHTHCSVGPSYFCFEEHGTRHQMPKRLENALCDTPHTYGALHRRLL